MEIKRLGTSQPQVSVLLKVSRLCFPDSCPTPRVGIAGQHPQLALGQLSRGGKAAAFSVLHGNTKAGKQRTGITWSRANPGIQICRALAQVFVCGGSQVSPCPQFS